MKFRVVLKLKHSNILALRLVDEKALTAKFFLMNDEEKTYSEFAFVKNYEHGFLYEEV